MTAVATILITGASGQVGWELRRTLAPLGEIVAMDRGALDLADAGALRAKVQALRPSIVVNAAAYTAVDQAEREPELAHRINAEAPAALAETCATLGSLLVHYSTDYVFDGAKAGAYTEADAPNPLNAYGRSKLAGERAIVASGCRHLIFRTSWVYGLRGRNFLRTIERLAAERDELAIVDDQIGAPTWSRMIAETTALALRANYANAHANEHPHEHPHGPAMGNADGIYHLSAGGRTSWHGFARAILEAHAWRGRLNAISSADYPLPARRPANSLLDNGKLARELGLVNPDWRDALALCLADAAR